MRLVLLTFGDRLENHNQASFAILSFLRSKVITGVTIVTDRPEYYQYFGHRIEVINCAGNTMQEWRGEHDFFWRIKMKAIAEAITQNPSDDILYVDSDTFLAGDLSVIQSSLDNGNSFMHEREGNLIAIKHKTERKMWSSLSGKTFGPVTINERTEMWNAGVIAISKSKAIGIVSLAIQLCDEMCRTDCRRRLIEQFAFGLALKHSSNLLPASTEIGHYHGNKPQWNAKIAEFFMYSLLTRSSFDEDLKRLEKIDYKSIPTVLREKNTKHRIFNIVNKMMKPKLIRFYGES